MKLSKGIILSFILAICEALAGSDVFGFTVAKNYHQALADGAKATLLIKEIIEIQSSNYRISVAVPVDPSGFLVTQFSPQELLDCLKEKNTVLWTAHAEQADLVNKKVNSVVPGTVLGFILVVDSAHFQSQLTEKDARVNLNQNLPNDYSYIYQVGILKGFNRLGIASTLMNSVKKSTDKRHVIADVLDDNSASLAFFASNHFIIIGDLYLPVYRDYGPTLTKVMLYEIKNK